MKNSIILSIFGGISLAGLFIIGLYIYDYYKKDTQISNEIIDQPLVYKTQKLSKDSQIDVNDYETVSDFFAQLDTNTGSQAVDIENEDFYLRKTDEKGRDIVIQVSGKFREELKSLTGSQKDIVILDIFETFQSGGIIPETASGKYGISIVSEKELPSLLAVHNDIVNMSMRPGETFLDIKKSIQAKSDPESKKILSYVYDYEGDYQKSNALKFQIGMQKTAKLQIEGYVRDATSNVSISGAIVEILNESNVKTLTDKDGKYVFDIDLYPGSRYRLRAYSDTHSDGFAAFTTFESNTSQVAYHDFTLHRPNKIIDIDLSNTTMDQSFSLESSQSTYTIRRGSLYYVDGITPYTGSSIRAYLYEFTKSTNMQNYMFNDTFDEVYGYVGNIMKTFGMPYLQIFAPDGRELHIKKSDPAILKNRIYHMKELYENYDKIYTEVTNSDMYELVEVSKKNPNSFPITRDWLIENNFLRWPAWWCLNRTKGVWEAVGQRVIDPSGIIETTYYTID